MNIQALRSRLNKTRATSSPDDTEDEADELANILLELATDILAQTKFYVFRCVETVTINGRILTRGVSRDVDLSPGGINDWILELLRANNEDVLFPLATRDKDSLLDHLDIDKFDGNHVATLPRTECQAIARFIIRARWDVLKIKHEWSCPDDIPAEFLLIPELPIDKAERAVARGRRSLKEAAPDHDWDTILFDFYAWLYFFTYNHVIWTRVKPPAESSIFSAKYRYITPHYPARSGAYLDDGSKVANLKWGRRIWLSNTRRARRRPYMRIATPLIRDCQSYHFRMSAPDATFVKSQRILAPEGEVIVRGESERPYVHLYTNKGSTLSSTGPVWASLSIWEAPPWSSTEAAMISIISFLLMTALILSQTVGDATIGSAAAVLVTLPAAAASWIGVATTRRRLIQLPRMSRALLIGTGLLAVASGLAVTTLPRGPVLLSTIGGIAFLQLIMGIIACVRTAGLRKGSRVLRKGPQSD